MKEYLATLDDTAWVRSVKIGMPFTHLKLGQLRLRGPRGAQDRFVLAAILKTCGGSQPLVTKSTITCIFCRINV